jgi:proliferating cell nuclear antigen
MEIELSNSERRTKTVNSIKLLDLDEVDYVIPQVEFDRVVSMPSSELSKHVREMATVSPYITIRGTRTTLEILAEGDMSSSHVIIEPTASGLNWRHSEDGEDIEGKYFAKYIEKFTKNSLANNVELFLKNNYPLIMRFEISIGCLRCCIAPIQEKV